MQTKSILKINWIDWIRTVWLNGIARNRNVFDNWIRTVWINWIAWNRNVFDN